MDYRAIINQWPSVAALAADIGMKQDSVRKWKERNRIPADRWADVEAAAKRRGLSVDMYLLAQISRRAA